MGFVEKVFSSNGPRLGTSSEAGKNKNSSKWIGKLDWITSRALFLAHLTLFLARCGTVAKIQRARVRSQGPKEVVSMVSTAEVAQVVVLPEPATASLHFVPRSVLLCGIDRDYRYRFSS